MLEDFLSSIVVLCVTAATLYGVSFLAVTLFEAVNRAPPFYLRAPSQSRLGSVDFIFYLFGTFYAGFILVSTLSDLRDPGWSFAAGIRRGSVVLACIIGTPLTIFAAFVAAKYLVDRLLSWRGVYARVTTEGDVEMAADASIEDVDDGPAGKADPGA